MENNHYDRNAYIYKLRNKNLQFETRNAFYLNTK